MSYNKKTWASDEVITKEALNNIEEGIEAIDKAIPTKTSQLINDSNFITEQLDLSIYAEKDELHEHNNKEVLDQINLVRIQAWDNAANKDDINLDDYALKSEIPVIPEPLTRLSELENDTNFITIDDVPACLITEEEKQEMDDRVKALEEVEHVSLEQYNALLDRIVLLEEALAALKQEDPDVPEEPSEPEPPEEPEQPEE